MFKSKEKEYKVKKETKAKGQRFTNTDIDEFLGEQSCSDSDKIDMVKGKVEFENFLNF